MQERHKDRKLYFQELARTSKKYFIPYIQQFIEIKPNMRVLEIGCGDGGNLLPLSEMGCDVVGVDLAAERITNAIAIFKELNAKGTFLARDIFTIKEFEYGFDLIICHDVIEHVVDKETFLANMRRYLKPEGIAFMSFPAWQMPFGGHQQICTSKILSHFPFLHLLPTSLYRGILKCAKEPESTINELLYIKTTKTPIELFEKLVKKLNITVLDRRFYFINPHYETKFGLKPRKLARCIGAIPWVRNFFTTSSFYMIKM